jgi:CBS domain containing-hemolysin-like protein
MLAFIGGGPHEDEEIPNTTVGSWVLENSGALPRIGEQFSWHNIHITVSRVQRHRVMEVTVSIRA